MLKYQFNERIALIAIFGILYIFSMLKKGKKNSVENPPEKHIGLKILSGVFLFLSLVSLAAGILAITNIQFPTEMVKQPITGNMIFRSPSATPLWGYPTPAQNRALMHITSVFASLAFAAYFAAFRKSGTNVWQKFLKVVGIVLMYMFFASATDLHYFDIYEQFAPLCFLILAFIGLSGGKKEVVEEVASEAPAPISTPEKENDGDYMPKDVPSSETNETIIETIDVEL